MNDRIKTELGYTLIVIGVILLFGIMIDDIVNGRSEATNEEVKCYDRWNNEIIGEVCIDSSSNITPYFGFTLLGASLILFGVVFLGNRSWVL